VNWFSTYHVHHRVADHFRKGRAFVLGDAAHIHSPVGAQGMNTGLQDAYNLAWKLALVVTGKADEELLDSYESERLPIAQRLLATTDRGFKLAVSDSWVAGLLRTEVIARIAAWAMRRERIQQFAFRVVSQIGIHYRDCVLSQELMRLEGEAPRAGDRFPWLKVRLDANGPVKDLFQTLDDTRFNLLIFEHQAKTESLVGFEDLVRCHVIPADAANDAALRRARIPQPSFYLVRPDGYVGLCGGRFDPLAMEHYMRARIHLTRESSPHAGTRVSAKAS